MSSIIETVASDLTALAPGLSTIDAVAKAISGVTGIIAPLVTESIQDKTQNELKDRLANLQEVTSLSADDPSKPQRMGDLYIGLCRDASCPTGELSGVVETVPVEILQALGIIAATEIAKGEQLNGIIETLKTSTAGK